MHTVTAPPSCVAPSGASEGLSVISSNLEERVVVSDWKGKDSSKCLDKLVEGVVWMRYVAILPLLPEVQDGGSNSGLGCSRHSESILEPSKLQC